MAELPVRKYMDDPDIKWRYSKPDYSHVNATFMKERTRIHKKDSLEKIVEDLVKTWEVESSHKFDKKDWKSVDKNEFYFTVNGGRKLTLDDNINIGNYWLLLEDCPLFDAKNETTDSSRHSLTSALPEGFAWELLELHSGPPKASFTWRHWGTWKGEYKGHMATGETLEVFGSCVVTVNSDLKIQSIEVYYDPNPMMAKLINFDFKNMCPLAKN